METRTNQILSFAKYTAILSFVLGTLIFLAYCYSSETNLLFLGYLYLAAAGLVNFIVFVVLIIASQKQTIEIKHKMRKRAATMLLNIPISVVYCFIAAQILEYVRIHLVNTTKEPISNIHIYGCDDKNIGHLDAGESKNVWVKIDNDCSITMEYMKNNKKEEEVIMGYCTSGMGQKITYHIGSDPEIEF